MIINMEVLAKTLKELPDVIEAYVRNIPVEILDIKRNDETWTIREHIYHIAQVQPMLFSRILKIKNEEQPVIVPYFPENETERTALYTSLDDAFSKYKDIRNKQLSLIDQLTEAALNKDAVHGEYIQYNIPIIINHMVFHEYWHMYRMEQIWLTRDEYFL